MPSRNPDRELAEVANFLTEKPDFPGVVGRSIRKAFDEVIDGPRTGRYSIAELEKTEKTYIGTKVEIVLRDQLELDRGIKLDNLISGVEVDTKFSLGGVWMIPREAVNELCLLVTGDDKSSVINAGLLRMRPSVLTAGANQDGKRTVSAAGKQEIEWLIRKGKMPENFLLGLSQSVRDRILGQPNGKQRLRALFREVRGVIIPRSAILQVAQLQGDPLKRAREAKSDLAAEGFQVLCATYLSDRRQMNAFGFVDIKDDDWVSI